MSRALFTLAFSSIFLMLTIFPATGSAQKNKTSSGLTQQDIQEFTKQSEQLVRFMEYAFNTLGNPSVSAREKDIIINQSYLKFFSSPKVQVEDDLVEGRFTVTNKDIQAYLKDIDFFFRSVIFSFNIENISYNVNESGQVFFIVTTSRNLRGKTVEGDTIFNNQQRFIEINLDPDKRDLKIASIYTSKLSEKEDMRNWWAELDADWRLFFAKGTMINEQYPLKDIVSFHDNWIYLERFQITVVDGMAMESKRADTVFTNGRQIYQEISRYWKHESVDLSNFQYISSLSPLGKLTELKSINASSTHVDDLTPIRNLTRLENLNISGSLVTRLNPLRFAINLKILDASNTGLSELAPVLNFSSLEVINVSGTQITSIEPLSLLPSLRDIRISNTRITNLEPLSNLPELLVLDISGTPVNTLNAVGKIQSLERLHADHTGILDLSPLKGLNHLQYLFIEATEIRNLQPLSGLPALARIYCDRTPITREHANRFMNDNPNVLVIYESQMLSTWWSTLPDTWKEIFRKLVQVSEPPTREELHQVANIRSINIAGNKEVLSLSPLQQLIGLRSLNAAETNIFTIETLRENFDLLELDISSTHVQSIEVISNLRMIQSLKLANLPIEHIEPLKSLLQLRYLDIDNTNVRSVLPLATLNNLEIVLCDGLNLSQEQVTQVYDSNPNVTIVYQTPVLTQWWQSLDGPWKNIFRSHSMIDDPPSRLQLQKLVDIHELDLAGSRLINNLEPIRKFHRLKILKMNNLQINDIAPLADLHRLQELYCSNNPINSLRAISQLEFITVLDCSNTLIKNLNDIRGFQNLEVLNISGTQVRSLQPLSRMFSLRQLDCYNTRIMSLRPLENLKQLELLRCYNTRVLRLFVNRFMKAVPDCEVIYY